MVLIDVWQDIPILSLFILGLFNGGWMAWWNWKTNAEGRGDFFIAMEKTTMGGILNMFGKP